jgi:hypothetical protein
VSAHHICCSGIRSRVELAATSVYSVARVAFDPFWRVLTASRFYKRTAAGWRSNGS